MMSMESTGAFSCDRLALMRSRAVVLDVLSQLGASLALIKSSRWVSGFSRTRSCPREESMNPRMTPRTSRTRSPTKVSSAAGEVAWVMPFCFRAARYSLKVCAGVKAAQARRATSGRDFLIMLHPIWTSGGQAGIRTREGLPLTHLAGGRFRPLSHLSVDCI
jgi:hypothetical protein